MGEVLVAMPAWKMRVDSWKERIAQQDNLLSYLTIIRMSPVPPHCVVNLISPHLGIGIPLFWASTALGVTAVSFIHVTIGQKLDEMTSPADFKLISWHNVFLLGCVCCAAALPIAVRRFSSAPPLEEADGRGEIQLPDEEAGTNSPQRANNWASHHRNSRSNGVAGGSSGAYGDNPYGDEGARSDDELPSIGQVRPGVRVAGAEADSSHWRAADAEDGEESEVDADVVHNPFDSDDDGDNHLPARRFSSRAASQNKRPSSSSSAAAARNANSSKAARTLGIAGITDKASKVLGLGNTTR